MPRLPLCVLASLLSACQSLAGVTFKITVDPALAPKPLSGRLIVSLIGPDTKLGKGEDPNNAPFWDDPDQPLFGIDVRELPGLNMRGLSADHASTLDDAADTRTIKPSQLPPGEYRAAARLITTRQSSNWRHDAGNLFSPTLTLTITGKGTESIELRLTQITKARQWPTGDKAHGAELVEVRSRLLSDFHKRDVFLRAGIAPPVDFDPKLEYAAIYEVPGFGGDHFGVLREARRRANSTGKAGPELELLRSTFHIVLDPESRNGHTLFADSANNGPCARALIEELIPAIEAKYPLIAKPEARLLRGHSSGGWSTLWLALNYPQVFGATWSSSPDPVDFRRLQLVNIYEQSNIYGIGSLDMVLALGGEDSKSPFANQSESLVRFAKPDATISDEVPDGGHHFVSYRSNGKPTMTVEQESRNEDLLGPDNTSGQQWDSWFAAWGPINDGGNPAALFDPKTGVINKSVLDQYRKYDISLLLRNNPAKYGPIFQNNVRLVVGDADEFFLNEAVALLKAEVDNLPKQAGERTLHGSIKILPGLDHGSIFGSEELRAFPAQMLEHLKRHALTPLPSKPNP